MKKQTGGGNPGKAAPARIAALDALLEVEKRPELSSGEALDRAIQARALEPRDARLATAIVFGVLRRALWLDLQYRPFLRQPASTLEPGLRTLFRMAAAQRFLLERLPAHAIVSDSVELARTRLRLPAPKSGFVNAVVRRVVGLAEPVEPASGSRTERLASALSHPEWLVELLEKKFGTEGAERILAANNAEAPVSLRANRLAGGPAPVLAQALAAEGIETVPGLLSPDALLLTEQGRLRDLLASPLFEAGAFYLQDEASQSVALLADPRPGERVLDLCSAPGGKATHMAELAGGRAHVTATDVSGIRLELVRENALRLRTPGMEIVPLSRIEAALADGSGERSYDLVLVDAPCSGLGTLRRNPEIRYRCSEAMIRRLAGDQLDILTNAARLVRPGGRLVYSTCTVSEPENRGVVEKFLASSPDFSLSESGTAVEALRALRTPDGYYRTWPAHPDVDGFEAAVLKRAP